jgi:hypothetical protein
MLNFKRPSREPQCAQSNTVAKVGEHTREVGFRQNALFGVYGSPTQQARKPQK